MGRQGKIRVAALAVTALSLLFAWTAVTHMSVTVDEFQAVPAGAAMLESGDLRFSTGTPIFSEVIAALPDWLAGRRVGSLARDPGLNSWSLAYELSHREGAVFLGWFGSARAMSLVFLFFTLALVFGYARSLYGDAGGLLALAVAGLSPNLLAHGALATPDIFLAAGTVAYLWCLDELTRKPGWRIAALLGATLAVSAAVKFTGLLFFPLAPFLVWVGNPSQRGLTYRRYLPAALALGLLGLHALYGFDGSLSRWGDFSFSGGLFSALQAHLPGALPVFLPHHYVRALDEQFSETPYPAYLLGEFTPAGFFSYYLVAFLVKVPIPSMALLLLACLGRGRPERRERVYLVFSGALFLFFSLARHKNIGLRYLLFLFPLLAIWCGRAAAAAGAFAERGWRRWAGVGLLAGLAAVCLCSWPDYLAYFNQFAGGGASGHRVLLDSNLDWGQGLLELRQFLDKNQVKRVSLAYAGRVPPELYGLSFETLGDAPPRESVVAISANLLWGRSYFVNGTSYWPKGRDTYAAYRERPPWAVLGHSIYVYRFDK